MGPCEKIFDGFSFELPVGKHFALVGSSGAGKSTIVYGWALVNLLLRQWDPQSGSISIGGHASLDVETEQSVMKSLKKLSQCRITPTIAHRLATNVDSDEILVMLEGKIAERDSHQQLMAVGGWYTKMFTMQLDEVDATITEA